MSGIDGVLILIDPYFECIVIPVKNFPVLPVGSCVDITLPREGLLPLVVEDLIIAEYRACNHHGTQIEVCFFFDEEEPSDEKRELVESVCKRIADACGDDPSTLGNWRYGDVLDFSPTGIRIPDPNPPVNLAMERLRKKGSRPRSRPRPNSY